MLTKREKKWLEERSNKCLRCLYYSGAVTIEGICFWCSDKKKFVPKIYSIEPFYRDAAEFEAQVQRALMYQYEKAYHCKEVSGSFMPDRDTMLMYARLAVEEEMDE